MANVSGARTPREDVGADTALQADLKALIDHGLVEVDEAADKPRFRPTAKGLEAVERAWQEHLRQVAVVLRSRDGAESCSDTDALCLRHGVESLPRRADVVLTLAEAIDLAGGDGLRCDRCGREIVAAGVPVTADVIAAIETVS
jgi:hypothetical protein